MAAAQAPQQPSLRTPSSAWVTAFPPQCAGRVTLNDVLLGPGPSLQLLRRRLPALVRNLRWYYGPVRLLGGVRVGRAACAFPHRPAAKRQAPPRSPGSRAGSFLTCTGSPTAPGSPPLAMTRRWILPSLSVNKVSTREELFRGSIGGPPVPLSTLHPRCRHRRRMTRGQRGSLNFRCGALSSLTPRRFIPALSDCPSCLRGSRLRLQGGSICHN